jgi:undecaprenyl diphosphate synthase
MGHRAGLDAAKNVIREAPKCGIEILSLFAFSSENWLRPRAEVKSLLSLFAEALEREIETLIKNEIRITFIGNRSSFPRNLQGLMAEAERKSATGRRLVLLVVVGYGGRWDICQACRILAKKAQAGLLAPEAIDERTFEESLTTSGFGAPDLLIRTGGERRLSNFLLWDLAYSELYFSDILWPDFTATYLQEAVEDYRGRQRRFGRTPRQIQVLHGG